jgi:hypothetical protein
MYRFWPSGGRCRRWSSRAGSRWASAARRSRLGPGRRSRPGRSGADVSPAGRPYRWCCPVVAAVVQRSPIGCRSSTRTGKADTVEVRRLTHHGLGMTNTGRQATLTHELLAGPVGVENHQSYRELAHVTGIATPTIKVLRRPLSDLILNHIGDIRDQSPGNLGPVHFRQMFLDVPSCHPRAYNDRIISSTEPKRRVLFGTIFGSKVPARSRGTFNCTGPELVIKFLSVPFPTPQRRQSANRSPPATATPPAAAPPRPAARLPRPRPWLPQLMAGSGHG